MEFKYDVEGLCGLGIVLDRCGGERAAYNPHFCQSSERLKQEDVE